MRLRGEILHTGSHVQLIRTIIAIADTLRQGKRYGNLQKKKPNELNYDSLKGTSLIPSICNGLYILHLGRVTCRKQNLQKIFEDISP